MKENIALFMSDMGIMEPDDISELYNDYLCECDGLIEQVNQILSSSLTTEWMELKKIIHNIKGVSANLYVQKVYEKTAVLDAFLNESLQSEYRTEQFSFLWRELFDTYECAKNEILQFFNRGCENDAF